MGRDLHWERKIAGLYETMFYAGEYRYRIEKDESYNTWRSYYMYRNSTEKKWKRLRSYGGSAETLKEAKKACQMHNQRPRAKWKCFGKQESGKYEGQYVFRELDRRGEPYMYRVHFMDPQTYMTVLTDDELAERLAK